MTRCLAVSTAAIGSRSASIVPRYRTGRGKERVLKNTSGQLYKWTSYELGYEATLYPKHRPKEVKEALALPLKKRARGLQM